MRGEDAVGLLQREAYGFFDKDVFAGLEGGDGNLGLGVGVAEDYRVEVIGEQFAPVAGVVRHVVFLSDDAGLARREIADHFDRIEVLKHGEIRQVLDLSDGTAADDADADGGHNQPSFPARGVRSFQRSPIVSICL